MNRQELAQFVADRKPGHTSRKEAEGLVCYGCAHSAAIVPPPGRPSGERPCMSCVRNREGYGPSGDKPQGMETVEFVEDDHGNARCFDAAAGFAYNGAPYVHWPMDNYVTLDQRDQEDFYEKHPDYGKPITFKDGKPVIVDRGDA